MPAQMRIWMAASLVVTSRLWSFGLAENEPLYNYIPSLGDRLTRKGKGV